MNDKIIKVGKASLAAVVSASVGFSILDTTVLADEQNVDSTVAEVQENLVVNEEPNLETVVSEEQNLETSDSKEVPMEENESVQPMAANDKPVITVMDTSVGDENGYTRLDLHFYDADLVDHVTINGVYRDLVNDDDSNLNDQNAGYVNGTNTVVVYDVLGNSSTFTFNYIKASQDTTPPAVVSITYSNDNGNKVTKEDVVVTITANEDLQPVDGWTVSGNVMTKTHSENGKYSVVMKDLAGNETIVNYEVKRIDKIAPVIKGITEGMVTNQDVTYTIIEQSISQIIIDGTVYNEKNAPKTITDEGLHTIKVIDKAGNETSVSFTIDRIGPTITVKEGSVGQDGIYSKIDLKLFDANKVDYVLINGEKKDLTDNTWSDVNFKDVQYKEGKNVVEAFDIAGNSSTFEFILDTKGPEFTVKDTSVGKDGVYSRLDLKLYDANKVDYVEINGVKKDLINNVWSDVNGKDVQYKEGKNIVVAYDQAGNSSTFEFIYDTKGPEITVKDSSIGKDGVYSKIDLKLFDANKVDYVLINGEKKDLTDNTWSDVNFKDVQYKEGKNVVEAFDIAGNSSTFEFILDTKGPEITVKDSSIGKDGVYSRLDLKFHDANKVDYVVINGKKKDLNDNVWSDLNDQNAGYVEGKNTVICYDIAGNSTEFTFIYDKTGPTITVKDSSIGKDGVYSRLDLKLFDSNKVDYVEVNGKKIELSDNTWSDLNDQNAGYKEGKNTVICYDIAGNSTEFTFIYDKTGPTITVKDSSIGKDGVYSRLDLKLHDANKVDYVEVNGKKIELSDNTWSDLNDQNAGYKEGENTVICYDIAGNSTEFTFIYDKTAPVIEANDRTINVGEDIDLMEGVHAYDGTVDLTASIEVTGTVDNTQSGQYEVTYKVTDQAGNTTEKTITITVNALPVFHADDITITVGDAFDPMQGVSAQDEEDGDLTDQIVIESNDVNVNVAGEYTIVYRVTDKSGASVTYTRNVTVEAPDTPVNPDPGDDDDDNPVNPNPGGGNTPVNPTPGQGTDSDTTQTITQGAQNVVAVAGDTDEDPQDEEDQDDTETEDVEEEETPLSDGDQEDVDDEKTPLSKGEKGWAIANLIAFAATVLLGVLALFRKQTSDDDQSRRSVWPKVGGIALAVASGVMFFMTQNFSLPMQLTDSWTVWMLILAVVEIVVFAVGSHWKSDDE